jgi:subtilisin family serine protease
MIRTAVCAVATMAVLTGGSVLPALAADEATYIISVPDGQVTPLVTDLAQLGETPDHIYTRAIDGVAVSLSAAEVSAIQSENPQAQIVPDALVTMSATRSGATWGISALDQATAPADTSYSYPDSAGTGVDVFVIDTGVTNRPTDFGGTLDTARARDFTGLGTWVDCNGHGTHVAGTIGSTVYGVASKATIIPVRVLDCNGSGSMSNVLAGINYAISAKTPGKTAVLNMSLGGGYAGYLNNAVDAAVDSGIVSAVAAGNSAVDACGSSPASAPKALTVGALSNSLSPAYFSNYGSCVDVYAPGESITSLWLGTGTATISGTSMASPHAAGVAALYIAANPTKTAAEVTAAIVDAGKVNCVACSPNKTLNIQNLALNAAPVTPPAPVVPSAPAAPTVTNTTATDATVSWVAPSSNGGATIDRYLVEYRSSSATTWQSVTVTAQTTSTTLASLTPNTSYSVRVTAHNSAGNSPVSATTSAQTLTGIPTAPRNVTVSTVGTTATVSWTAPSSTNGAPLTAYRVEYRKSSASAWQSKTVSTVSGAAPATTTNLTGLVQRSVYQVRVSAQSQFGSSSATGGGYAITTRAAK